VHTLAQWLVGSGGGVPRQYACRGLLLDPTPGLWLLHDLCHCPMLLRCGSIRFPILVKVNIIRPSSFAL